MNAGQILVTKTILNSQHELQSSTINKVETQLIKITENEKFQSINRDCIMRYNSFE